MSENTQLTTATRKYEPLAPIGSAGNLRDMLQANSGNIAVALPKHVTPERLIKTMLVAVNRTPGLLQCTQSSIMETINRAAELGLDLSGTLGEAYPVPFNNKIKGPNGQDVWVSQCQLIIGYRGMEKLAWQTGEIQSIDAEMVHERDTFVFKKGSTVLVEFTPCMNGDRGKAVGAYCCITMKSGGTLARFVTISDIEKIRAKAKSGNSPAWTDHYDEMGRKCAIKRTLKDAPLSTEKFARAMEIDADDDSDNDTDVLAGVTSSAVVGGASSLNAKLAQLPAPVTPSKVNPATLSPEPVQTPVTKPTAPKPAEKPIDFTVDQPIDTSPVDASVFPAGPKDGEGESAPAPTAAQKQAAMRSAEPEAGASGVNKLDNPPEVPTTTQLTWENFCAMATEMADFVAESNGVKYDPKTLSEALTKIRASKKFAATGDTDETRQAIMQAIEEARGAFTFLAKQEEKPAAPAAVVQPETAETSATAEKPTDWATFKALAESIAPDAAVCAAGLKKVQLRNGWLGPKEKLAAEPVGVAKLVAMLAAMRENKWDWSNGKSI